MAHSTSPNPGDSSTSGDIPLPPGRRGLAQRDRQAVSSLAMLRMKRAGFGVVADAPSTARLDATDLTILALETRAPGPHQRLVGLCIEDYMARIFQLLYDADANAYAGETLARLRAELCHQPTG